MFNRHDYIKQRRANKLSDSDEIKKLAQEIIDYEFKLDDDFSREAIIAREIGKTTWASFRRFGDKNCSSKTLRRNWIDADGIALDVQAMFITEQYGVEILPGELAEFIQSHESGKAYYQPYQHLANLKTAFNDLTGYRWEWNPKFFREQVRKTFFSQAAGEAMPF